MMCTFCNRKKNLFNFCSFPRKCDCTNIQNLEILQVLMNIGIIKFIGFKIQHHSQDIYNRVQTILWYFIPKTRPLKIKKPAIQSDSRKNWNFDKICKILKILLILIESLSQKFITIVKIRNRCHISKYVCIEHSRTQQVEAVFNKISGPSNKNYPGLLSMLQGFHKCIA